MSATGSSAQGIVKREITLPIGAGPDRLAFVLDNVLTKEECEFYIAETEKRGYTPALIDMYGNSQVLCQDVRNSSRCMWDSVEEAEKIWRRIKSFIPEDFVPGYKPLGLNERLRFLRYYEGEYFKAHYDGSYRRQNGEESYVTLQLYLNEGFEGGCTTFLAQFEGDQNVPVVPKTGSALIFEHHLLHEGSKLEKGVKYAVRTDIMFGK